MAQIKAYSGGFVNPKQINIYNNGWQYEKVGYVYNNGQWIPVILYPKMLFKRTKTYSMYTPPVSWRNGNDGSIVPSDVYGGTYYELLASGRFEGVGIRTVESVDLTPFTTLWIRWELYVEDPGDAYNDVTFEINRSPYSDNVLSWVTRYSTAGTIEQSFDISALSGQFYAYLSAHQDGSREARIRLYDIWLM